MDPLTEAAPDMLERLGSRLIAIQTGGSKVCLCVNVAVIGVATAYAVYKAAEKVAPPLASAWHGTIGRITRPFLGPDLA